MFPAGKRSQTRTVHVRLPKGKKIYKHVSSDVPYREEFSETY